MPYRISKHIGYFIPNDMFSGFLNDDYDEILETLDYSPNELEVDDGCNKVGFLNRLEYYLNYYLDNTKPEYNAKVVDRSMVRFYKDRLGKFGNPLRLIQHISNGDTFYGLMFCTPEGADEARHNSDIDHYEAVYRGEYFEYHEMRLKHPLVPGSGYIFKGGDISQEMFENIKSWMMYPDNVEKLEVGNSYDFFHEDGIPPFLSDHFHPNVQAITYIIAKASGILNPSVDELKFRTTVIPSIITTWG